MNKIKKIIIFYWSGIDRNSKNIVFWTIMRSIKKILKEGGMEMFGK